MGGKLKVMKILPVSLHYKACDDLVSTGMSPQ